MSFFKFKIRIKSLVFLSFIVFSLFGINLFLTIMEIPNEISISTGQEVNLSIPVNAVIKPQENSDFAINNEPVKTEVAINATEENKFYSNTPSKNEMTFKLMGLDVKTVPMNIIERPKLIPSGESLGVKIFSSGVMVLGTGYVNDSSGKAVKPSDKILKSGDIILEAEGQNINSKEDLMKVIKDFGIINMKISRDNEISNVTIHAVKDDESKENKIGVWVRDSTQGIGTITYYNPKSKIFGALGHGIMDVDTKKIINIDYGDAFVSDITSINKGEKGQPGELVGDIENNKMGDVLLNSEFGIFGKFNDSVKEDSSKAMDIALQDEVEKGPAKILCNVQGSEVKEYDIYIENVDLNAENGKQIILKITDKTLLSKTNGIVQGMSGSPIIQNGRIVGAITHVFVQDPTKGYGVFIENMLSEEDKIN